MKTNEVGNQRLRKQLRHQCTADFWNHQFLAASGTEASGELRALVLDSLAPLEIESEICGSKFSYKNTWLKIPHPFLNCYFLKLWKFDLYW